MKTVALSQGSFFKISVENTKQIGKIITFIMEQCKHVIYTSKVFQKLIVSKTIMEEVK